MAGFSYIDETTWKYLNPGTADLLTVSGTTVTADSTKSRTGTAFYQTTRAKCFDIPAASELWIKADLYHTGSASNRFRIYNGGSHGVSGICLQSDSGLNIFSNGNLVVDNIEGFKDKLLQTYLVHLKSGVSDGLIEFWVDDILAATYTGNVNNGDDFADLYLQCDNANALFSNVVISNVVASNIEDVPPSYQAEFKPEIYATWIPNGNIAVKPEIYATVCLAQQRRERVTADTARIVKKPDLASGDTLCEVTSFEETRGDTLRQIFGVSRVVDTTRADLLRKVIKAERAVADTKRKGLKRETISADTFCQIIRREKVTADVCRALREFAKADTLRNIQCLEKAIADIAIRHPHILNYFVEDSFVNTFKDYDITSFDVTLSERTLSDTFNLGTAQPLQINDAVRGRLLDYSFSFLVEETNRTDLIQSISGMYDIDKLLYTYTTWGDMNAESEYPKTSEIMNQLANYFSLTPNIRIADFTPYYTVEDSKLTYSDLISTLFSWTSRVPQRQINVFIRGGTLNCIQRGMEDSVFDITDLPHSRPTIKRQLLRSMYNNPNPSPESEEDIAVPFTGSIAHADSYSENKMVYSNGLLVAESSLIHNTANAVLTESAYTYTRYDNNYYNDNKVTEIQTLTDDSIGNPMIGYPNPNNATFTKKRTETVYYYSTGLDGLFLYKEYEVSKTVEDQDYENAEVEDRLTFHSPVGNGWYSTTVFVNGEIQGSSLSQGKPNQATSQYTINRTQKSLAKAKDYESQRSNLSPIADVSFPVRELDLLEELTNDLLWLNRKVQENVTVELIDKIIKGMPTAQHIVDFTERIKIDGAEYFLVSNNVSFTPRRLIQKLELVRWY